MMSTGLFFLPAQPALLAGEAGEAATAWFAQPAVYLPFGFSGLMVLLLVLFKFRDFQAYLRARKGGTIRPDRLESLMLGLAPTVLDLRPLEAFQGAKGHIRGAIAMPLAELPRRLGEVNRDPRRPVILVDETDLLSHQVAPYLRQQGFPVVFVLQGGLRAWRKSGLPVYHHSRVKPH